MLTAENAEVVASGPVPGRGKLNWSSSAGLVIQLLLAVLILMWPAFVNGQPFFMTDTSTYVRGADAVINHLTGAVTDWSGELMKRFPDAARTDFPRMEGPPVASPASDDHVVLLGRSVYYGLFLFAADRLISLWGAVAVQAALAAAAISLTIKRFAPPATYGRLPLTLLVSIALSLITPLAFFTSFLMPDLFAGLGILAVGRLMLRSRDSSASETCFWLLLVALAALFHSANILILLALVVAMTIFNLVRRQPLKIMQILPIAGAIGVGIVGELLFSGAVEKVTGSSPIRPPFVTARLIADGPGADYLGSSCPKSGFALCRYRTRLPDNSDGFLWSPEARDGLFSLVGAAEKRQIAADDRRFALAVLTHSPLAVIRSSAQSVANQASRFGLAEFNYNPQSRAHFAEKLPPRLLQEVRRSEAWGQQMPTRVTEFLSVISVLACAAALGIQFAFRRSAPGSTFAMAIALGIAINVAVCGALSTPHDRYFARVLWLVPLVTAAAFASGRTQSDRREPG